MQGKGYASQIVIDFETTFGQDPVSPNGLRIPFNTCELKGAQAFIDPATIRNSRSAVAPGLGRLTVEGPMVVPMCYKSLGYFFKAMFGAPTTTNADTAGYLTGGAGVTTTIGTWTAITDGSFSVSIDGSASDVTGINFTGDAAMTDVAADIQTAIRAIGTGGFALATVTWNATTASFKITSGTTGPSSSVGVLSAAASGTNISATMKCTASFATATAGLDLYSHKYVISTSAQPSLVVEKGFTDLGHYFKYNGVKVGGFKLVVGEDGELVGNVDLLGSNETPSNTAYDSTPTDVVLTRINNFQAVLKEGGSETALVKTAEFNFNMGLDGNQFVIGAGNKRGDIPEGMVAVTGTIKALFTSMALLNKGINTTESSQEVIFTDASNGSTLSIKVPEIYYDRTSPSITGPAGVELDLNWRGFYDNNADASAAVVTLVNSVSTYA